jgi:peptidyl-prolyl cis-trans isomerase B (cyclophilin B)
MVHACVTLFLVAQQTGPLPKGQYLRPEFTYNGIDRSFPIRIELPKGAKKFTLQIQKPASFEVLNEIEAKKGMVDLAQSFPGFWSWKRKEVTYLQLTGDGKKLGPALVLQPMTNPQVVTLDPTTKNPKWEKDEDDTYAGIRVWVDQNVLMTTEFGEIEFKMRPDVAPNAVWNFQELIKGGFYRDIIFHRIVQKHPRTGKQFVIQAGDPTGTGAGSPGYAFPLEQSTLKHDFGVLGMARSTDPNTNGSQFYVALSREATQHLDGRYVTYGECVRGQEVIRKIANVEIGPKDDRPVKPPLIRSIKLVNP